MFTIVSGMGIWETEKFLRMVPFLGVGLVKKLKPLPPTGVNGNTLLYREHIRFINVGGNRTLYPNMDA